MLQSKNKRQNLYHCTSQFYFMKVGFERVSALHRSVSMMEQAVLNLTRSQIPAGPLYSCDVFSLKDRQKNDWAEV